MPVFRHAQLHGTRRRGRRAPWLRPAYAGLGLCDPRTLDVHHGAAVRFSYAPRALKAADLRGLHGHGRDAGVSHLADKALGLALRRTPVVIALAIKLIDPDHAGEHVHTRFPDFVEQGVGIPARRLHKRLKRVPGFGALRDVACDLGFLRMQERLELPGAAGLLLCAAGHAALWGCPWGAGAR